MVRIYSALKQKKLNAKLIIQIHDELIFDVPGEELDQVEALVKKHMEEAIALKVPIRVNIAYGKNWGELKAIA
jgi:DNA polymerase-1